jgi:hypothetical protein
LHRTLHHNIMPPLPNQWSEHLDDTHLNLFNIEFDTELDVSNETKNTTFRRNGTMSDMNDNILTTDLQKRRSLQSFCVNDEIEFRTAIANAPNFSPTTRIDICVPIMNIDGSIPDIVYQGIGIIFKNLDIRCNTSTPKCVLNAQDLSRHFYVNQSTVVFRKIIFQSGNGRKDVIYKKGGALLVNNSIVSFDTCQFRNSIGTDGGAIRAETSTVTFFGGNITHPTLFEHNYGTSTAGGAISIAGWNPTVTAVAGYFVFRNNSITGSVR